MELWDCRCRCRLPLLCRRRQSKAELDETRWLPFLLWIRTDIYILCVCYIPVRGTYLNNLNKRVEFKCLRKLKHTLSLFCCCCFFRQIFSRLFGFSSSCVRVPKRNRWKWQGQSGNRATNRENGKEFNTLCVGVFHRTCIAMKCVDPPMAHCLYLEFGKEWMKKKSYIIHWLTHISHPTTGTHSYSSFHLKRICRNIRRQITATAKIARNTRAHQRDV